AGEDLAFRHQLLRDAIYEEIPRSTRAALHLQAGRALAAAGAPTIQVATQLSLGGTPGAREGVSWLGRAAADALASAPEISVQLLTRALDLAGDRHPDADRLHVDLASALVWSGRAADSARMASEQ